MDTTPNYGLAIPSADETDLMDADLWRTPFGQVDTEIKNLDDRVDNLDTTVTTVIGDGAINGVAHGTNFTVTNLRIKCAGKMRHVTFTVTRNTSALVTNSAGNTTNTPLFTLPVGHRPGHNVGCSQLESSGGDIQWVGMLQTTGIAYIVQATPSSTIAIGDSISGSFSYLQEN